MAVVKVPFDSTRARPGVPVSLKSAQTATGIDIDCMKGKVCTSSYFLNVRLLFDTLYKKVNTQCMS